MKNIKSNQKQQTNKCTMNDFFEVNLFQDYHENQLTVLWHLFLEGSNPQCFLQAQLLGGKSVRWPKSNSKYSYDLQFSNIWVSILFYLSGFFMGTTVLNSLCALMAGNNSQCLGSISQVGHCGQVAALYKAVCRTKRHPNMRSNKMDTPSWAWIPPKT